MAEQKEPIRFRENCPPSYPPHQHHQHNHHGNQEQSVGGFPNQYFSDIHRGRENSEKGRVEQGGGGFNTRPLLSWRYKFPRLFEFPILLEQARKFLLHSHIVCFVEFTRQRMRLLSY